MPKLFELRMTLRCPIHRSLPYVHNIRLGLKTQAERLISLPDLAGYVTRRASLVGL
jgi:hypothetical protein